MNDSQGNLRGPLATARWQAREAPANGKRRRRPLDSLPRLGILAGGEFDEEAAAEFIGACPRVGAEIAVGTICGSAVQSHLPAPETRRKHEMRHWRDPSFDVGLDEEFPAIGAELEAVVSAPADLGARARVVEPQLAGGKVVLSHEPIREDPAEGQAAARHDDVHLECRALGRIKDVLPNRLARVRSRSEPDQAGEAGEQRQRDNHQRRLH